MPLVAQTPTGTASFFRFTHASSVITSRIASLMPIFAWLTSSSSDRTVSAMPTTENDGSPPERNTSTVTGGDPARRDRQHSVGSGV